MNKRLSDSFLLSFAIVTSISTVCTILGFSMKDAFPLDNYPWWLAVSIRGLVVIGVYCFVSWIIWLYKGYKYGKTIKLMIGQNSVTIKYANIFNENAWRVIPVDTCFHADFDHGIISETSLHGQFIRPSNDQEPGHGEVDEIKKAVEQEAVRLKITKENNEKYHFQRGTVIPYRGLDGMYLMVALNELNENNESSTTMADYEIALLRMWREISRVYNGNDIAIPLLGGGITRFEDCQDDTFTLLRCILCTLNTSKVHFSSNISIVLVDKNQNNVPFYNFKDLFRFM